MVEMQALLSEDETEVELRWLQDHSEPAFALALTAEELEGFIQNLIEVRAHMQPPVSRA
jgi:hypothetical protein